MLRGELRELSLLSLKQESHHGHKSLQEAQRDRAGLRAQPGAISSTAVLGGCQSPGTGIRELWGLLLGESPTAPGRAAGHPALGGTADARGVWRDRKVPPAPIMP